MDLFLISTPPWNCDFLKFYIFVYRYAIPGQFLDSWVKAFSVNAWYSFHGLKISGKILTAGVRMLVGLPVRIGVKR
jgi:hypothetical protein